MNIEKMQEMVEAHRKAQLRAAVMLEAYKLIRTIVGTVAVTATVVTCLRFAGILE